MKNNILEAREKRSLEIKSHLSANKVIICIKANIPGDNKSIKEAHVLVRLFTLLIQKKYDVKSSTLKKSEDGPYTLLEINSDEGYQIKKEMIAIEDTHPMGRFVDLDVFYQDGQSLSRRALHIDPRKCYLCQDDAHLCSRTQKHPISTLIEFIQLEVKSYLKTLIQGYIEDSILEELELEDKFGLVTPSSCGSHPDMDYQLMIRAKDAILPFLVDLFILGYQAEQLDHLIMQAKAIGIEAENKMFETTHGINAYKGLIYILGLALVSLGYTVAQQQDFKNIFENMSILSESAYEDFDKEPITAGISLYRKHNITGIRGEAYRGIPSVLSALPLLIDHTDITLRNVLKHLILVSEDTVFLKRAHTIKHYNEIKDTLRQTDLNDQIQLKAFNQKTIQEHLSFGGSADLLIVTIFLKAIHPIFFR
ncbi:MAG: citrate lyase holo-[acyl-carrier protein] synthase [Firmicutes bacterium]|nr:citrate lyase holo-[acyl-carrier protein] synthase [Bacillota bacterium]